MNARRHIPALAVLALAWLLPRPLSAQINSKEPPPPAQGIGVTERLGETIPLDAAYKRADGTDIEIGRFFSGEKPVVLLPIYFDCPVVCPVTLDKFGVLLNDLDYTVGKDFNVVVLSFDHTEGPTEAASAKLLRTANYREGDRVEVRSGFGFLTGNATQIRRVTDAVGFNFKPLPGGEFSHPIAAIVLSPRGKITRYLYGLDFPPEQIRYSLLEASEGRIAQSLGDVLAFACFRWDPTAGKYSASAMAVMRIAGVLTVLGLIVLIGGLFLAERVKRRVVGHRPRRTTTARISPPAHGGVTPASGHLS